MKVTVNGMKLDAHAMSVSVAEDWFRSFWKPLDWQSNTYLRACIFSRAVSSHGRWVKSDLNGFQRKCERKKEGQRYNRLFLSVPLNICWFLHCSCDVELHWCWLTLLIEHCTLAAIWCGLISCTRTCSSLCYVFSCVLYLCVSIRTSSNILIHFSAARGDLKPSQFALT